MTYSRVFHLTFSAFELKFQVSFDELHEYFSLKINESQTNDPLEVSTVRVSCATSIILLFCCEIHKNCPKSVNVLISLIWVYGDRKGQTRIKKIYYKLYEPCHAKMSLRAFATSVYLYQPARKGSLMRFLSCLLTSREYIMYTCTSKKHSRRLWSTVQTLIRLRRSAG